MKKMNIGLGCSGGTAAPMAAACKYVVEEFSDAYNIWALPECWRLMTGLTDEKCHMLTPEDVKDWDKIGGSPYLPSCKNTNVFKISTGNNRVTDYSKKVRDFYESMHFHCVLYVGGGGTSMQIAELSKKYPELHSEVLLATMDNDVSCFDNCLGFKTAVQYNAETIVAGISDAYTMQRPTLVFTMGYDTGKVALEAALRAQEKTGKVNFVYLPESGRNADEFARYLKDNFKGKGTFVGVCSEGVCCSTGGADGIHKKFDISSFCKEVEEKSGIPFKVLQGDYRQRSGLPVAEDLELAKKYVKRAFELVSDGCWNQVIGGSNAGTLPCEFVGAVINQQDSVWTTWFNMAKPSIVL